MKKQSLVGFVLLLMTCIVPVSALTAVDDAFLAYWSGCYVPEGLPPHSIGNVLNNDIMPNPGSITVEITQQPKSGELLPYLPEIWYSLNKVDFVGSDIFYYRLYDGQSYSNIAKVTITVVPRVPAYPIRTWLYTPADTALNSMVCSPWGNDDTIISSTVNHGTIRFLDWGHSHFEYTPDAGFTGWDTFTYVCHIDSADYGDCFGRESEVYIYVGNGHPIPEFPSAALPVALIIGFLSAVLLIRRTKEH